MFQYKYHQMYTEHQFSKYEDEHILVPTMTRKASAWL